MRLGKQVEVVEEWKPFSREDMDFEGVMFCLIEKGFSGVARTMEDEH